MKRFDAVAALALCAALAPAPARADAEKKPTPEPFYRKYMVPGDPLDDKIVEMERRVEASPEDPSLRNDFGNLLAERKFPAQAAEQYEIALHLDKKNFISAYNLGLLRETEGKVSEAISAYKRSIKRKPGFPQSHFRLGRLYEQTNETRSAVHEYAAAMWIDPAIRDPRHNPLIIDSELIYLASLANYERDLAVASMVDSHVYNDTDRYRKLPTNRVISSKEIESDEDAETAAPRDVGSPAPAGAAGASEPARRGAGSRTTVAPGQKITPGPRRPPLSPRPQPPGAAPVPAPAAVTPAPGESAEPPPGPEPSPEPSPEAPSPDVEPS
jgi:tetratricopeptide (TPR) repeat protein